MVTQERDLSTVQSQAPTVTPDTVRETKQQIGLLQGLTRDLLTREVDYGRIPGTPADCLWGPGAAMIISAFNCYAGERRLLSLHDEGDRIAVLLEVPLISRASGKVMATGVGAASTLETKYKYRWLSEAEIPSLDGDTIATFKTRDRNGTVEYRVPNPEHGELLNTILKMASKRAEVDAAESLPGVASVLRALFTNGHHTRHPSPGNGGWTEFWGEARKMGYTHDEVRNILGVHSVQQDWVGQGRTLEQALEKLQAVSQG